MWGSGVAEDSGLRRSGEGGAGSGQKATGEDNGGMVGLCLPL
jgi:hypothetical protein